MGMKNMIMCSIKPPKVRKIPPLCYVTPLLNKSYYCTGLHPPHQRPRSVSYWSLENLTRCPIEVARLSNRHAEARGKLLRVIAGGAWTKLFHVIVGDVYAVIFSTKG